MTQTLDRTGNTAGDFEWMSSRREAVSENQTRTAPIADSSLKEALGLFDSVQGDILAPIYARFAFAECANKERSNTYFQIAEGTRNWVGDPVLRLFFDDRRTFELSLWVRTGAFETVMGTRISEDLPPQTLTSGSANPADVLLDMSRRLGLPMEQVLDATDIPSSTFYHWKKSEGATKPRLASHRRLWALVQFVEDAEEIVGPSLQQWILARPERRESLFAGNFDALLKDAAEVSIPDRKHRRDLSIYAVGGETAEPPVTSPQVPSRLGKRRGTVRGAASRSKG